MAESPRASRLYYRIVRSNPPTRADFLSHEARGLKRRNTRPDHLRLWDGISVYDEFASARHTARNFPVLGAYIAALRLPEGTTFRLEKTLSDVHHYTIWADPDVLLAAVVSVISVEEGRRLP